MLIKQEKGFTGIDIAISIVIITIFIAVIGNLIVNINLNSKNTERESIATSYAVKEIEKIKALGYIEDYENKGIEKEDKLEDADIDDINGKFSGFHKTITIRDYVLIKNDNTKEPNLLKELKVEISYKIANKEQKIEISTYVTKE